MGELIVPMAKVWTQLRRLMMPLAGEDGWTGAYIFHTELYEVVSSVSDVKF